MICKYDVDRLMDLVIIVVVVELVLAANNIDVDEVCVGCWVGREGRLFSVMKCNW